MARTSTREKAAAAPDRASKSLRVPATIPATDIARRAYDHYVARGCEDGRDVEDWLQAERELTAILGPATSRR